MILEIDAGNSFLKWRCGPQKGRLATIEVSRQSCTAAWQGLAPSRVRMASVAPQALERELERFADECWGVRVEKAASQAAQAGVTNSYADVGRMGVDRWLVMLAAYNRSRGPCCVVDCGSAITVDYLDGAGRHLGGYIMPGLRLMRDGLLTNTERVRVEVGPRANLVTPGCSTEEAVDHGVHLMVSALAERVVKDIGHRLGGSAGLFVTGGDGPVFREFSGCGEFCPELVLDGLVYALP